MKWHFKKAGKARCCHCCCETFSRIALSNESGPALLALMNWPKFMLRKRKIKVPAAQRILSFDAISQISIAELSYYC